MHVSGSHHCGVLYLRRADRPIDIRWTIYIKILDIMIPSTQLISLLVPLDLPLVQHRYCSEDPIQIQMAVKA